MNRNAYHFDLFRPRDQVEVMEKAGHRGHGTGRFLKATVTNYTSRFQANEAWKVEFTYNESGEKGIVTLDNHFEEVRLLERPAELPPDELCPVCRVEVGTDCFSICCDRCDNWVHGTCDKMEAAEGRDVKKYYCPPCCRQHGLEIQYKKDKKDKKRKHGETGETEKAETYKKARAEKAAEEDVTPSVEAPRLAPPKAAPLAPKVVEERECAYTECSKRYKGASKYCCPEHGRAQAMAKFQAEQARASAQKAAGKQEDQLTSPKAKGMTRADAEDLAEFARIQEKIGSFKSQVVALEARRKKHEAMVLENATRLIAKDGSSEGGSSDGSEGGGGGSDKAAGSEDLPEVSPKSGAASKDSWLHDCPTCGKQISSHLILRHQESCFQRATKETYGSAAAAEMTGGKAGSVKKNPAQICGYPLPPNRSGSAGSPKVAGCSDRCMVPWQQCDKHLNWENHKRQELSKEQYVLDRHVETLREQEEVIQSRMRRRLQQLVDGDAKGNTTASN